MTITTTSVIGGKMATKKNWKAHYMSKDMQQSQGHLCLKKGQLSGDRFKLSREYIPTIKDKPANSLGKRFDHTLKDPVTIQETRDRFERWLNKFDRSGLPGGFNAWIYQHVVLPKISWPLTICEFTSYNVEQLKKKINSRLRRWLWLSTYGRKQKPLVSVMRVD